MILFMDAEPLLYQIALTLVPGIGDVNARKLVSYTGSPEAVFKESRLALRKIPGIGEATVDVIFSHRDVLRRASEEVEFVQKYSIRTSFFTEKGYQSETQTT